jgi:hypothetical protein
VVAAAPLRLPDFAQDGVEPASVERPDAPVADDATRATESTQPARATMIFFKILPFAFAAAALRGRPS